jgi:hypothetical protein
MSATMSSVDASNVGEIVWRDLTVAATRICRRSG